MSTRTVLHFRTVCYCCAIAVHHFVRKCEDRFRISMMAAKSLILFQTGWYNCSLLLAAVKSEGKHALLLL